MIAWEAQTTQDGVLGLREMAPTIELHDLTTQLIACDNFDIALDTMLNSVIRFHGADFGNVQLYRDDTRELWIARQQGFNENFLKLFARVTADDPCACGRALRINRPIIVPDVEQDEEYGPFRAIARDAGYRGVQSTPIVSSDGDLVGVLSTHFRAPRIPTAVQMHLTHLYARQAGEILVRLRRDSAAGQDHDIVARELSHRLKNVLAMVQAIARQSMKGSSGLRDFASSFEARLAALARAHSLLSEGHWQSTGLRKLLGEQLLPMNEKQIVLAGPEVAIDADAAYVVSLLTHELAVNAQKYGALSSPTGRASVAWSVDPKGPALQLDWVESGGPAVRPPQSSGFGTALMRSLNGSSLVKAEMRFEAAGVVCALRVPLKAATV